METKEQKNNKGITLIALVVLIVVLLIIAGVSITTLVGDNGIINRTIVSKVTTEKVGIKERISLAVTSALMDGIDKDEIDLNTLNDELIKDQITIIKKEAENALPWIVEENKNIFKIKDNGEVVETDVYTVTVNAGNGISSVNGNGMFREGEEVTVGYTLNEGYHFKKYTSNINITIENNKFIMPEGNLEITVNGVADDIYIFKEGIGMLCDYNVCGNGYTAPSIYTSYIAGNRTITWDGWDQYFTESYYNMSEYDYLCVEMSTPSSWTEWIFGPTGNEIDRRWRLTQEYNRKIFAMDISNLSGDYRILFGPKMKGTYMYNIWLTNDRPDTDQIR